MRKRVVQKYTLKLLVSVRQTTQVISLLPMQRHNVLLLPLRTQ
jgi:hypothetical protein